MKIARVVKLYTRYFFSFLLFCVSIGILVESNAQDFPGFHVYDPDNDSIQVLSDSLFVLSDSSDFLQDSLKTNAKVEPEDTIELFHSGFYIKLDYGKLLTLPAKFESKLEGSVGVIVFRRLVLNGTYGQATLDPLKAYKNVAYYTIEGNYMKFGMDYYFDINPKNFLTLGARYAMCNYSDDGKFLINSDFFGDFKGEFGSSDLSATWFEIVMDSETLLLKNLYLGAQFSLRIMIDFESREDIPVYAVPGYGRTFDNTVPAVSLFLKYKIPFN